VLGGILLPSVQYIMLLALLASESALHVLTDLCIPIWRTCFCPCPTTENEDRFRSPDLKIWERNQLHQKADMARRETCAGCPRRGTTRRGTAGRGAREAG